MQHAAGNCFRPTTGDLRFRFATYSARRVDASFELHRKLDARRHATAGLANISCVISYLGLPGEATASRRAVTQLAKHDSLEPTPHRTLTPLHRTWRSDMMKLPRKSNAGLMSPVFGLYNSLPSTCILNTPLPTRTPPQITLGYHRPGHRRFSYGDQTLCRARR